jgi:STE24 endopeptidase
MAGAADRLGGVSDDGPRPRRDPALATALVVTAVGMALLVLLALLLVPWDPVPGGDPDPVAVGEVLTPAQLDRAESYATAARAWSWSGLAVTLLVGVMLAGAARKGGWLRRRLDRWRGPEWLRVAGAAALVGTAVWLVGLPFAVGGWRLRRSVGLSTQDLTGYARDRVVWQALELGVTVLLLLGLWLLVRRLPRRWPLAAAAATAVATLVISFGWPVLVEPLFNRFEPMADGSLRRSILQAAEQEGVPVEDVLVADASRRTTALNAYVSGYGATRRVVVYDTLVEDRPDDEVLSVAAHELAHARYDDPLVGALLGAAGAVGGVGALAVLLCLGPVRRRWGAPGGPAGVPLVLATVAVVGVLTAPVASGISRAVETRADVTALATTQDPGAFARMQRELAVRNLSDPTPPAWSQWWWGTHPTVLERVAIARAWQQGSADGRRRGAVSRRTAS